MINPNPVMAVEEIGLTPMFPLIEVTPVVEMPVSDKKGFMWFGTADGLNRYDGENIRVYKINDKKIANSNLHTPPPSVPIHKLPERSIHKAEIMFIGSVFNFELSWR